MKISELFKLALIIGTLPVTLTNGTVADATQVMSNLNKIVNDVNANAAPLANTALLNANNNFTAVQSGIAATGVANFPIASQVQNWSFNTLTSTLGTNAITARVAALPLTAYATGQAFTFVPSQTNTGPVGITIDAAGSSSVFSGGASLLGGELVADVPAIVVRNSSRMDLIGTPQRSGPWTPTLLFGGGSTGLTYTTRAAEFVKIGKLVHISFNIIVNDNGSSSGAATITGLPFISESIIGMQWSSGGYAEGLNAAGGLVCWLGAATSTISLGYADATGVAGLTEVEIINGATISCSMTYRTSA